MSALDALALRCGIEPAFTDARGDIREASAATRRRLLAAMGIAAADEVAARESLQEIERLEWSAPLPPVCVWHAGRPQWVDLNLPADAGTISWRIELEDGGERCGRVPADALAVLAAQRVNDQPRVRRRLVFRVDVPCGYHRLVVEPGCGATSLIMSPGQCWLPQQIPEGRRLWGVAAQLYLLRSSRNWGIGDYGDLRRLVHVLTPSGADVVGLNPLHALFLDDPDHASPYSPASRLMLNVLNIDVAGVPEFAHCAAAQSLLASSAFQRRLERCRDAHLVDYRGVAELKVEALRLIFAECRSAQQSARWREFEAFRRQSGDSLERGCVFLCLREYFAVATSNRDWHSWPAEYRDPASASVSRFAAEHSESITFHAWLQFIADAQLAAAAAAAQPMAVGLYRDLAVGADRAGAETWANQQAVIAGAAVGAPPDIYNPPGQDWGLPPFNPRALRDEAYRSFIELIRANMRHAGGLRIDHVMALQQLYWIPAGQPPSEGAYVRYPLDDLVGILALESQRNRCLVVGEDLGTVPAGFRERMAEAHILSYRVLYFERDANGFLPPERYPKLALAVAGSHDLPTLHAWWDSSDLKLKESLDLFPTAEDEDRAWTERRRDIAQLADALRRAGLAGTAAIDAEAFNQAAHRFLARSTAAIALAQMDDITDETSPVNVPTTADQHPNWRRRLSLTLDEIVEHPRFAALVQAFRDERDPSRTVPKLSDP